MSPRSPRASRRPRQLPCTGNRTGHQPGASRRRGRALGAARPGCGTPPALGGLGHAREDPAPAREDPVSVREKPLPVRQTPGPVRGEQIPFGEKGANRRRPVPGLWPGPYVTGMLASGICSGWPARRLHRRTVRIGPQPSCLRFLIRRPGPPRRLLDWQRAHALSPARFRAAVRRRLPSSLAPRSSVQAAPRPFGSLVTRSSAREEWRPFGSLAPGPSVQEAPRPFGSPMPTSSPNVHSIAYMFDRIPVRSNEPTTRLYLEGLTFTRHVEQMFEIRERNR
jgi:hypothetical protein